MLDLSESNMVFLEFIELLFTVAFLVLAITQVIIPILLGRPLFPSFRSERRELEKRLAEAKEKKDLEELKEEVERQKPKVEVLEDPEVIEEPQEKKENNV